MTRIVRDNIRDQFSFYLKSLAAVFTKIMFMMSRDLKCVRGARKWRHSVRTLFAIILELREVSSSKTN